MQFSARSQVVQLQVLGIRVRSRALRYRCEDAVEFVFQFASFPCRLPKVDLLHDHILGEQIRGETSCSLLGSLGWNADECIYHHITSTIRTCTKYKLYDGIPLPFLWVLSTLGIVWPWWPHPCWSQQSVPLILSHIGTPCPHDASPCISCISLPRISGRMFPLGIKGMILMLHLGAILRGILTCTLGWDIRRVKGLY